MPATDSGTGDWLRDAGAECLATRLRRASDRWAAVVRVELAAGGLSGFEPGWWPLFRLCGERPGIAAGEAAAALGLSPAAISQTARALTRAGLLREEPDAADARVRRLRPTAAGEELRPRLRAVAAVLAERATALPRAWLPDVEAEALRERQ